MGIELKVSSAPGSGSCFELVFSCEKLDHPSLSASAAEAQNNGQQGLGTSAERKSALTLKGKQILLVEDNRVNQVVLEGMLRHYAAEVDCALSGLEALESLRNKPYDLVFMDVHMPGMDGLETTRELRRLKGCERIPVIACTASALEQEQQACFDAGMNGHLSKPIQPQALASILEMWLGESSDAREASDPAQS